MYRQLLVLYISFFCLHNVSSCSGGVAAGALTATVAYQTVNVLNGNYYTMNVSNCDTYTFTFCSNGGTSSEDTQLTILNSTGVTEISYSDDVCGLLSEIVWTADFTGSIRILISNFDCIHDLGSSSTLAYKYSPKAFCITNNAAYIDISGEDCIQLTGESNNETGCAWNDNLINFANNFTLSLDYYFGNNINGADGTTFTFHPNIATTCGSDGGELGAGGIANSLIVEFDTYDNDFPTHAVDIAADHIAIETDGSLSNASHYAGPIAALASLANIDDGFSHQIQITWNSTTHDLKIYFDAALRLTANGDFVNTVFGGDNTVYWGATAATGGLNNQQYFCPSTVVVLPVELLSFGAECIDNKNYIQWTTSSENRLDYFVVESTTNGILYEPIGEVNAWGNTTQTRQYLLEYTPNFNSIQYYRLKMVDDDGNFKITDLIMGKNCSKLTQNLLQNYSFTNGKLIFNISEKNSNYQLYTITGQEIIPTHNCAEQTSQNIVLNEASQGMYLLYLESNETGKKEIYRIFNTSN